MILQSIDWIIIAGFFVILLAIGYIASKMQAEVPLTSLIRAGTCPGGYWG